MCGIYGFIGTPTDDTPKIIEHLGRLNEIRGKDSTGIAIVYKNSTALWKKAEPANKFFATPEVQKRLRMFKGADLLTILGHTRAATHGDVSDANAHPFKIGNYLVTHNGVISNFYALQDEQKTAYAVDSQIIGHMLNEETDYREAFKQLAGWFTAPYINLAQPDALNVAIHDGVFAFGFRKNQLYYSSDFEHLRQALGGRPHFTLCKGGDDVLYRFYPIHNSQISFSKEKIEAKKYIAPVRTPYRKWETDKGLDYEQFRIAADTPDVKDCEEFSIRDILGKGWVKIGGVWKKREAKQIPNLALVKSCSVAEQEQAIDAMERRIDSYRERN